MATETSAVTVSSGFEGGSIEVLRADDPGDIRVRLKPDAPAPDMNWFCFRVSGVAGRDLAITIENSDQLARLDGREEVPDCWTGYRPFVSEDGETWVRGAARYEAGIYTITHAATRDTVWVAYYPPFPMARHDALVSRALADPRCRLEVLGQTPDGRDLDCLRIGTPGAGKPKVWIMGRQHPSETMAGFFVEGLLARLLDRADALGRAMVEALDIFVIPTVNPDGCARAHTRMNARGMNLNRAWAEPDMKSSPEVAMIVEKMRAEGVDFCLDAHGDEELPYVFLGGPLEIPSRSDRLNRLFDSYTDEMARACPAYSRADPYPGGSPTDADLRMAWNWIAEEFDCLSVLLEMPFKDTHRAPDEVMGWGPERCADFGRATLDAIAAVAPDLRP